MKYKLLFLGVLFLISVAAVPQSKNKTNGYAKKAATINVYKDLKNISEFKDTVIYKVPEQDFEHHKFKNEGKVIFKDDRKAVVNKPNRVKSQSPAPERTFLGLLDTQNSIPPDVMGGVGPDNVMTTLNTQVRVHDREGNNLFTTSLGLFWKDMPGHTRTFDPKITYDPYAERWIFVTPSHPDNELSKLYLGVSKTSDPLGEWDLYWLNTDPSDVTWFDFPTIGFNKKWIVVCGNMFGGDFYRTVFVYDKQAAYNGVEDLPYTRFATNDGFTLVPTFTYDTTLNDIYLLAADNGNDNGAGTIKKFIIKGDVDNPQFIYQGKIQVPDPWSNWAGEAGNFLPQLGTEAKINAVDTRFVNAVYRNGKIWAVHHIFLPANNPKRTAVQWWVLDTTGVIIDRGRIEDPTNTFHFAFPAIAVNKYEDVMIGHGVFSPGIYASAGYSYRNHTDPAGTVRTYFQYKDGLDTYNKTYGGARNRWGDYSATCLDPVDQADFWVIQEYAETPANTWSTWWAYVKVAYKPVADFEAGNTVVPKGEKISFTDLSKGIPNQWQWIFEGGEPQTSSDQNPENIQYNTDGTFDVTLIVTNELGSDTIVKEDYITVSSSVLPDVDFYVDKNAVCVGEKVQFTDSTAYMPVSWEWEFIPSTVTFEEGTDMYSQNPVVSFDQPGNYSVKLTASNINGSSSTTKFDFVSAGGFMPYYHENFENGIENDLWKIEDVEPEEEYGRSWEMADVGYNSNHSARIRFTDYVYWGHRDRLITPPFNLENMSNAVLEFKHAYAKRFDDATDSLIVLISDDCGTTWTRIAAYGDDGNGSFATSMQTDTTKFWVPKTLDDWCGKGYGSECKIVDLSPWIGKSNVMIAFESFNFFGNALYIDNVTVEQYTGVKNEKRNINGIIIYPNPAKGEVTVNFDEKEGFNIVEVYDVTGKKLYENHIGHKSTGVKINTGKWSRGVYFVKLSSSDRQEVKRLVLE